MYSNLKYIHPSAVFHWMYRECCLNQHLFLKCVSLHVHSNCNMRFIIYNIIVPGKLFDNLFILSQISLPNTWWFLQNLLYFSFDNILEFNWDIICLWVITLVFGWFFIWWYEVNPTFASLPTLIVRWMLMTDKIKNHHTY